MEVKLTPQEELNQVMSKRDEAIAHMRQLQSFANQSSRNKSRLKLAKAVISEADNREKELRKIIATAN